MSLISAQIVMAGRYAVHVAEGRLTSESVSIYLSIILLKYEMFAMLEFKRQDWVTGTKVNDGDPDFLTANDIDGIQD